MTQLLMRMVTRASMAAGGTMTAVMSTTVTMTQAFTVTTTAALTTATMIRGHNMTLALRIFQLALRLWLPRCWWVLRQLQTAVHT